MLYIAVSLSLSRFYILCLIKVVIAYSVLKFHYELFSSHLDFLCLIAYPQSKRSACSCRYNLSTTPCRCSTVLSTNEIHMVSYKYTREAFLQFPTLAGESPKWNILVVTWALVIYLKYMHKHEGAARVRVCIFQANHLCPCYN